MLDRSIDVYGCALLGLLASTIRSSLPLSSAEFQVKALDFHAYVLSRYFPWFVGLPSLLPGLLSAFSKSFGGPVKYRRILIKWDPREGSLDRLTKFLKRVSENRATAVFTRRGSPLAISLASEVNSTLVYLRQGVPYPMVSEEAITAAPTISQLVSLVNRIRSSSRGPLTLVLDNLTDLTMILGLRRTYELLRELMDSVEEDDLIVGILVVGAQTQREETLLRSLFPEVVEISRREGFFRLFR